MSVSFTTGTDTAAEADGATNVQVTLHTTLPALTEDMVLEVADAGSGTATSGTDYTAFATQEVTFPAGSVDGATQDVTLEPLDDLLVEGASETVRLRLQSPAGGSLSSPTTFTMTVTDSNAAVLAFASGSAGTGDEATGPDAVALELDCGPGVTLGVSVSCRVFDSGSGTASSSSDYAPFATSTVVFPAGSTDGTIETVNVQIVDDGSVEGDETVVLALSHPSSSCTLGFLDTYTLTIEDDDVGGPAELTASEGLTGTQNGLTYDEDVDLGSANVGAGPNAGTLMRFANTGGASMSLGVPQLGGSHPNDFALELESSSTVPVGGAVGLPVGRQPSPLAALPDDGGPGVALAIDAARLARLRGERQLLLDGFVLPDLGAVTLELRRRPLPLTDDARLLIDGREVAGGIRTLVGDLQLWNGSVAGLDGSRVFLALDGATVSGFIELPWAGDRIHVMADGPGRARLVREPELMALGLQAGPNVCAADLTVPGVVVQTPTAGNTPPVAPLTLTSCRLAIETDWQLYQKFGSSAGVTSYVTGLIGAISDQYVEDVQTTLSISSLGIHTTSNDGWTSQDGGGDALDLLNEFRAAWGTGWAADADLAHFISGAGLGGGVAYVDALCNASFGFGVSGNISGNIDWATWTGASAGFTWDFVVVAHELGHNFGSPHTHSYCPPLDDCYTNCDGTSACPRGTIMSYCHLCGGMANIDLQFHPVAADRIRGEVATSCLGDASLVPGDFVQFRVRFNPLTDTGARQAQLTLEHNAPNATNPFRVQLSGTAD